MKEDNFEKIISEPAKMLERVEEAGKKLEKEIVSKKPLSDARNYINTLGPGITAGAADDDPSGIATYSQAGAKFGFQLIWLSVFSFPLMAVVQEMCARIGLVTGQGLAANIRKHCSKKLLYILTILLVSANVFNIGADLGAMAKGAQLILPSVGFAVFVVGFALISLLLQIFTTYARYAKYLKYLALALFAYVASALFVHMDWHSVLYHTFIPSMSFSKDSILMICAILGTTISPYLFFWQTSQEVEEEILKGEKTIAERKHSLEDGDIRKMRTDVWSGMFISNLVMFFIIAACSATLFGTGIGEIKTAADAAIALRPFAGNFAYVLFAVGIIGTGMLAIPVLAGSASYAVSESRGWKFGLYKKLKEAYAFYGVIIISMILGILLNFVGLDPIKTLIYSAIFNGIVSPVILFFIVNLSGNKKIMGKWANKPATNFFGWFVTVAMALASISALILIFFK